MRLPDKLPEARKLADNPRIETFYMINTELIASRVFKKTTK